MARVPERLSTDIVERFAVINNTLAREVKNDPKDRITLFIQLGREPKTFHSLTDFLSSFWSLVSSMIFTDLSSMFSAIFHSKPRSMYLHVIRLFNNLKIFWPVVALNTINVMYQLVVAEFSPYGILCYKNRVKNVTRFSSSMVARLPLPQITVGGSVPTFKVRRFLTFLKLGFKGKVFTLFDLLATMSTNHRFILTWIRTIFLNSHSAWGNIKLFIAGFTVYKHDFILTK